MAATILHRPAPPNRFDRRLMAPIMIGAILNPVNSSIIAVALVPIGIALGAPPSETAWLVSGLYLATAIGQPLLGRFVDTYGTRKVFLVGALLTLVAGIVGTLTPNIWVLVIARVILGFGTCAGYPAAMRLIRSEADRTGVASPAGVLTTLSIVTQTIAVIGPTLGGVLLGVSGWRSTFAINIVLGAASFLLGWLFLPRSDSANDSGSARAEPPARIDVPGIVLFVASLVSVLLFLTYPDLQRIWLLALGIAAGIAFVLCERRRRDPFIDVGVFAGNLPLMTTYIRALLASTVSYTFLYGFTQWLQDGRHLQASVAGLVLLPIFGVGLIVTVLTGRRRQVRVKLIVGASAQLVSSALLLILDPASAVWMLLLVGAVLGIAQGMVNLANQNAAYYQADAERIATSAGLLRTFMYVGAIIASVAIASIYGEGATTAGVHELGWFAITLSIFSLVLAITDRGLARVGTEPAPTP